MNIEQEITDLKIALKCLSESKDRDIKKLSSTYLIDKVQSLKRKNRELCIRIGDLENSLDDANEVINDLKGTMTNYSHYNNVLQNEKSMLINEKIRLENEIKYLNEKIKKLERT